MGWGGGGGGLGLDLSHSLISEELSSRRHQTAGLLSPTDLDVKRLVGAIYGLSGSDLMPHCSGGLDISTLLPPACTHLLGVSLQAAHRRRLTV